VAGHPALAYVRKDVRVRILFTFAGGSGHFHPLVPVARAAEAAGHVVAFAARTAMVATVQATGFPVFPTGERGGDETTRIPLRRLDPRREDLDLRDGFAGWMARGRAEAIQTVCADWRPDLVVCDETDFGSMVVAERLGLPYASVLVIAAGGFVRAELLSENLNALRAGYGLPPDPDLAMLSRYLVLSPVPPGYRDPAFPLPPTAHAVRLAEDVAAPSTPAPWTTTRPGAPTVYFTLGTVFNIESGDLFPRVLAGLRDLPVNLVVTMGRQIDPAEFGPQPDHVHLARYIPQSLVLPHCDAVVSHGGSGSTIGALAYGLPMVLIPMGADQPHNAARCERLGVARVLDAVDATPEAVRDAVSTVLAEPAYRQAARAMRDDMGALPGPEHAVTLLERLAADRCPVPR